MSQAINGPSTALIEHALSLIAGAAIERPDQARRLRDELEKWRTTSGVHESAYEQAVVQWRALGDMGTDLRARFDAQVPSRTHRKPRVRATLAVAAVVLCMAGLLGWHLKQATFDRSYQTGTAQLLQVPLPDGSRIDVNAKSTMRVTLYRDRRMVELRQGEARFEVVSDARRPFRVVTRDGVIEVIGTIFTVADRGDAITVEVERGRVRFLPGSASAQGDDAIESAIPLNGSERLVVRNGVPDEVQHVGHREFAAWRDGWLVFDNEPVADVLPAINAFRAAPIVLADPRAGALRLTGRFRATDSRGLLSALPKILPVKTTERPDGSVEVGVR